jgi:hypothetical protein
MLVNYMADEHGVSIRQGCNAAGLARSTFQYQAKPKQDEQVIDALNALVAQHPAIGFWQAFHRLRRPAGVGITSASTGSTRRSGSTSAAGPRSGFRPG